MNWKIFERGYIKLFKSFGAKLLNRTNGGDWTPDASGKLNGNFGKKGALNHKSKAVYVFDSNGFFIEETGSMRQAGAEYNLDFSGVVKCCQQKDLYVTGGFCFRYKSDFKNRPSRIKVKKRVYSKGVDHPCAIQVNQYDKKTGRFISSYESLTQASKSTELTIGSIRKILAKKVNSRKFIFSIANPISL